MAQNVPRRRARSARTNCFRVLLVAYTKQQPGPYLPTVHYGPVAPRAGGPARRSPRLGLRKRRAMPLDDLALAAETRSRVGAGSSPEPSARRRHRVRVGRVAGRQHTCLLVRVVVAGPTPQVPCSSPESITKVGVPSLWGTSLTMFSLRAARGAPRTSPYDVRGAVVFDDLEGIPISADGQVDLDTAPFDVFSWRQR